MTKGLVRKTSLLAANLLLFVPSVMRADPAPTALPDGGKLLAGDATVQQTGAHMTIEQNSNRAALQWDSFNVGAEAQVTFDQPSSASVMLNQINDQNPSQIFGRIDANGQVFLSNPHGIYFAPDASVSVGGLIATTHQISIDDFMAGKARFDRNGATGSVLNAGKLKAALGGYIALLAPEVRNHGVVIAQTGTVALAAGEAITVNIAGDHTLAGLTVTPGTIETLVENKSAVLAPGGLIILSAQAAENIRSSVVRNSGIVEATELSHQGGRIILDSSDVVENSGSLNASSDAGAAGSVELSGKSIFVDGQVDVSSEQNHGGIAVLEGETINLAADSSIDASGATGGGNVFVGGDWQGSHEGTSEIFVNPDQVELGGDSDIAYEGTSAIFVNMDENASIDASVTENGDGGTIVLWSDVTHNHSETRVAGTLTASGGAVNGKGGKIETSGHKLQIENTIAVDAGEEGEWLLDPHNIVIDNVGGDVTGATIEASLNAGTSVTLDTSTQNVSGEAGDIFIRDQIDASGTGSLTLKADRDIVIGEQLVRVSGDGANLNLTAKRNITDELASGNIHLETGTGNLLVASDSDGTNGGNINLHTTGSMSFQTAGGDITFAGGNESGSGYAQGYDAANHEALLMSDASSLNIDSNGGDIDLRGRSATVTAANGDDAFGVGLLDVGALNIDSGTGEIHIEGVSQQGGASTSLGQGVYIRTPGTATITSAKTSNDAIVIQGDASASASSSSYGIELDANAEIHATGTGGGILLDGRAGTGSHSDLLLSNSAELLAAGGDLQLLGQQTGGQFTISPATTVWLGSKSATNVATSSSDITLQFDTYSFNNERPDIATTGEISWLSASNAFGQNISTDWFTWNADAAQTMSGLTIGKPTNTTVISLEKGDRDSAAGALTVNGGLAAYGSQINLSNDLVSSASGDIFLQANGAAGISVNLNADITKTAGSGTLTAKGAGRLSLGAVDASASQGLNVVFWSDYDGGNEGGVTILDNINTGGGHFWAGGSDESAPGSDTWNNLTVGNGPSEGAATSNFNALDLYADVTTAGGNMLLWAGDGHAGGADGVHTNANRSLSSDGGDITLITDELDGNTLTVSSTGMLIWQPNSSAFTSSQVNLDGQLDFEGSVAADIFSGTGDVSALQINNYSTLGGLTLGKDGITTDLQVHDPIEVNGDVNLYGQNVTLDAGIDTSSGGASGDLLVKATDNIAQDNGVDMTTGGGDVIYWSDSDANSAGHLALGNGASILTTGGDIIMGGGADSNNDGAPDEAASGAAYLNAVGDFYSGISLYQATLDTRVAGAFDANAGDISLTGQSTYTGGDLAVGVLLFGSKVYGNTVDVTGSVTDTGGTTKRYGISSNGAVTPNNTNISSYGDITLSGTTPTPADQWAMRWGTNHELHSLGGNIAINAEGQLLYLSNQTLNLSSNNSLIFNSDYDAEWRNVITGNGGLIKQGTGELSLTNQNSYTGATTINDGTLIIRNDAPSVSTNAIHGPGELIVESSGASFTAPLTIAANISGVSDLTIGKSTNTGNVTISGDISSNDTVTIRGGAIDLQGDVTSIGEQVLNGASLTIGGAVNAGSADVTLTGDTLSLGGNLTTTGDLLIKNKTAGTSIGVGNGSGTLEVDLAEFARLQNGIGSVTIGGATAGDLEVGGLTSLPGDTELQAGASADLQVSSGGVNWSSGDALTLSAGQDIFINDDMDVDDAAATLNLFYGGTDGTTAPNAGYDFYIDVANRKTIDFAHPSASLKLGNVDYTLIDSVADFTNMTAAGNYALTKDHTLSGPATSNGLYGGTFTGNFDGLGHALDGLQINAGSGGNYGLFSELSGASVRHLGVTEIDIRGQSSSSNAADDLRIGGIVGNVTGSGTTVLDGVWSTGVISTDSGSQQDLFYAGGLVGGHDSGTLNISRSFSTANVSSEGSHSAKMALGGLLGDSGSYNGTSPLGGSAVHLSIDQSYATGSIVEGTYNGYYGSGGLVGVAYGSSATLTDSFSHSNVVGGISSGGIAGYTRLGTTQNYQRLYTTLDRFGNRASPTSSYHSGTLDAATSNGSQLPSGWSSTIWSAADRPTLNAVQTPLSLLYVQVTNGTSDYGDQVTPNFKIVDYSGTEILLGSGAYSGLNGVTGTGRYTIGQFASAGSYNTVSYLSGLSLTGNDAGLYALKPYATAGSYIITPRELNIALTNSNASKVYDGSTAAPGGFTPAFTLNNFASGDTAATTHYAAAQFNDKDVADADTLTVSGISLTGITGSNGSQASDYSLDKTSLDTVATITAKPLTVSGITANDKVYDGTAAATTDTSLALLTGAISGDDVSLGSVTGAFTDKQVGTGKTVSLSGATINGIDAGNYSATFQSTALADITARPITISGISAADKIYDGTTAATLDLSGITLAGMIAGDDVTASGVSGSFADKTVANGKTVTLSGMTYGGADAGNYTFTDQGTATADISAKAITLSGLAVNDRVYDGSTQATVDTSGAALNGLVSGDSVALGTINGTFADKHVGTAKAVSLSGITFSGSDAGNYVITTPTSATADITAKPVGLSGVAANDKVYDGTTSATIDTSGLAINGVVSGDDVSLTSVTATFADKQVGVAKPVSLTNSIFSGADAGNYTITPQSSATADITAKPVTISGITAADKVYDGTSTATLDLSGITFGGMISGDDLNASGVSGSFTDKNVATGKTVTLSGISYGGADVTNYTFTDQAATSADISAKAVTLNGLVVHDRIYDGTAQASVDISGAALAGLVSGDSVTLDAINSTFADKHAGMAKVVSLSGATFSGTDAGNYIITTPTTATADIVAKPVTVSGIVALDKVYDGGTDATLQSSGVQFNGLISGDDVSLITVDGGFIDKHVASQQQVILSSAVYGGADMGNYQITDQSDARADITARQVTVTGIEVQDKLYDGGTTAVVDSANAILSGLIGGDDVSLVTSGAFFDKNAGTDKTVSLSSSLSGTDAGNYAINAQTTVLGDILAKPLSLNLNGEGNKVYDGSSAIELNGIQATVDGVVAGDTVIVDSGNVTGFVDKHVGGNKAVNFVGFTLSGSDAANYELGQGSALSTATITPKPLQVDGLAANDKVYDGTTTTNIDVTGITFNGIVNGDELALQSVSGNFDNKQVGSNKSVTLTSVYTGSDVDNYTIIDQASSTADITARTLTVSGITTSDKVYDGTTSAAVSTDNMLLDGLVTGDDLQIASISGAFLDKHAGQNKEVTLNSQFTGSDLMNYTMTHQAGAEASITPKPVVIDGINVEDKIYDGFTTASIEITAARIDGVLNGDELRLEHVSGNFSDPDVGNQKTVSLDNVQFGGADAQNYQLQSQADLSANILPADALFEKTAEITTPSSPPPLGADLSLPQQGTQPPALADFDTLPIETADNLSNGFSNGEESKLADASDDGSNYTSSIAGPENTDKLRDNASSIASLEIFRTTTNQEAESNLSDLNNKDADALHISSEAFETEAAQAHESDEKSDLALLEGAHNHFAQSSESNLLEGPGDLDSTQSQGNDIGFKNAKTGSQETISTLVENSDSGTAGKNSNSAMDNSGTDPAGEGDGVSVVLERMASTAAPGLVVVTVAENSHFEFQLPEPIVAIAKHNPGKISVRVETGEPIPDWLTFDPATLRFSANSVPGGALPLKVLVFIDDKQFTVSIVVNTKRTADR